MGLRSWHSLKAGFKQKLNMSDLHEETDEIFEKVASEELIQALKESEPETDFNLLWRNDFSQTLEIIAAQQTRRSQAAECRKLFLKSIEENELALAVIEGKESDASRMFFEEDDASDMSDEMIGARVARFYALRLTDRVALQILYTHQFDSTLSLEDFSDSYINMCKITANYILREVAYNLLLRASNQKEEGWDKFYVEVVSPASTELEPIKQQFEENLCLLSPKKPDAKAFYEFSKRWRKAITPYLNEQ